MTALWTAVVILGVYWMNKPPRILVETIKKILNKIVD